MVAPGGVRFVTVILVDQRGWLLLQERDDDAPVAPGQWGLVGGGAKTDEDFERAIYRELAEETGLRWESGLSKWFDGHFQHTADKLPVRFQVWVAPTTCSNDDIVCGEGRQIVFIDPLAVKHLDLGESARHFVHDFLASPTYSDLVRLADAMCR